MRRADQPLPIMVRRPIFGIPVVIPRLAGLPVFGRGLRRYIRQPRCVTEYLVESTTVPRRRRLGPIRFFTHPDMMAHIGRTTAAALSVIGPRSTPVGPWEGHDGKELT
jgi:hypothetical protein